MKFFYITTFLILTAQVAFSMYGGPLLVKKTYPGLVPSHLAISETCHIYFDRVEITRHAGSTDGKEVISIETKKIEIKGELLSLIAAATGVAVDKKPGVMDAPHTVYKAFHILPSNQVEEVVIDSNGFPQIVNPSREAVVLKNFMDINCQ